MTTIPDLDWNRYITRIGEGKYGPLQVTRVKRLTQLNVLRVDLQDQQTRDTVQVLVDVTTGELLKANPAAQFAITARTIENTAGFRRAFDGQSAI